jgi:hypothetical protein
MDKLLKQCLLGAKKCLVGMAKLMARAGQGLHYSLPKKKDKDENADFTEESLEDKEEDCPFEPLMLWKSQSSSGRQSKGTAILHVSKRYTKTKQYYLQDKASVSHFCF